MTFKKYMFMLMGAVVVVAATLYGTGQVRAQECPVDQTEQSVKEFTTTLEKDVKVEILKDRRLQAFKEALVEDQKKTLADLQEFDTQYFITKPSVENGMIIILNKGCMVDVGSFPVKFYDKIMAIVERRFANN